MEQFVEDLKKKYEGMTPYQKLALSSEQDAAVKELEAAYKKCLDMGIGFGQNDFATYAYNDEDVYDFDTCYSDYSVCDVELEKLRKVDVCFHDTLASQETVEVSFYSTTFLAKGITH